VATCQLESIRVRLASYSLSYKYTDDRWRFRCCELALEALEQGNYGVGAVLIDRDQTLLVEASNQVFSPQFSSSAHAEMRLLDRFEQEFPQYARRDELTLITSLEPCPMCCCRILAAGIGCVVYLSRDNDGGMMSRCSTLPAAWKNLSQLIVVKEFDPSHELSVLAHDIAAAQKDTLRNKLIETIRT